MYARIRYRRSYDLVDFAARKVNEQLESSDFPPVLVEAHCLLIPRYPEVVEKLLYYLPSLEARLNKVL